MNSRDIARSEKKTVDIQEIFKKIGEYINIFISISGFVPQHATITRVIVMGSAFAFTMYLSFLPQISPSLAIGYYIVSTLFYMTFIYLVLPRHGYRNWFINKFGEQDGFLSFEASLSFLFFLNGASIGIVSSALPGDFNVSESVRDLVGAIAIMCIIIGFAIKVWAAKVVSVDIYYWKDMFLGRKITDFVVEGPYKFVSNPMYGLGHLQAYGIAIWYMSYYGFLIAFINQLCIFSFYFLQEKKFIKRVYLQDQQ